MNYCHLWNCFNSRFSLVELSSFRRRRKSVKLRSRCMCKYTFWPTLTYFLHTTCDHSFFVIANVSVLWVCTDGNMCSRTHSVIGWSCFYPKCEILHAFVHINGSEHIKLCVDPVDTFFRVCIRNDILAVIWLTVRISFECILLRYASCGYFQVMILIYSLIISFLDKRSLPKKWQIWPIGHLWNLFAVILLPLCSVRFGISPWNTTRFNNAYKYKLHEFILKIRFLFAKHSYRYVWFLDDIFFSFLGIIVQVGSQWLL